MFPADADFHDNVVFADPKKIHAIASQHYIKTPLKNSESLARIEVLTALLMRSWDFWDVTPCYWSIGSLHFKWLCPLHLQAYSVHQSNQFFMDCLFLKMKVTRSSGTSETTDPATQCHIPDHLNPHTIICLNKDRIQSGNSLIASNHMYFWAGTLHHSHFMLSFNFVIHSLHFLYLL